MSDSAEREERLVQYLLGRLPAGERVDVEASLFDDGELDDQLLETTDELIHAYLAGALSGEDRRLFESHFLAAPEHRERLAFVRDLVTLSGRTPDAASVPTARRTRGWLAAAAVLALIALGASFWLVRRAGPPAPRSAAILPETDRKSPMGPSTPPWPPSPSPAPHPPSPVHHPDGVHLVLLPGKATAPVGVRLSADTRVVRLQIPVDKITPSFDAVLRRADGTEVWRAEGVAPTGVDAPLVLDLPVALVTAGDYALRIEGESMRETPAVVQEYRLRVRSNR